MDKTPTNSLPLPLVFLISLFIGVLVIASVLAAKIIVVGAFFVPAGILAYSLTFLCTDIIGEVYGKQIAQRVVLAGFIALLVTLGLIQLALIWPPAPIYPHEAAFKTVLSHSERIIIASIIAYLISQLTDVRLFALLRQLTQGRLLWLRNNLSTIASQLLDSIVFILIAFYGTALPLFDLIIGQWLIKLVIAALDTPFIYAGIYLIRRYPNSAMEHSIDMNHYGQNN